MSALSRTGLVRCMIVGAVALAAGAGCGTPTEQVGDPQPTTTQSGTLGESNPPTTPTDPDPEPTSQPTKPSTQQTSSWPSPSDCISYNPNALSVNYEAGIYSIREGSKEVLRLPGGPGENVGEQGLALAQRYRKHCFIGRTNDREDRHVFIFDYWRDASGAKPAIADEEENCSDYNRNNLMVDDMGSGHGWRVKDHDHVLHVFDNEKDARDGKLVLAKYHQICFLGHSNDEDDPDLVSYSL